MINNIIHINDESYISWIHNTFLRSQTSGLLQLGGIRYILCIDDFARVQVLHMR